MFRRILIPVVIVAAGAGAWAYFSRPEARTVTTNSEVAYEFYLAGQQEREKLYFTEAAELFENAIAADETFAMAYADLAMTTLSMEDRARAKTAIGKAYDYREQVTELERLVIEYQHAIINEQFDVSEQVLITLSERFPDEYLTLSLQAARAMVMGENDKAIEYFQRCIEADPTKVLSHNNLGYLYMRKGRYDEAIRSLKRYAYYAPDQPNPHDSLGEAYENAGHYDEAAEEYITALEIRPVFWHSASHLSRVLTTTGQIQRARLSLDSTQEILEHLGTEKDMANYMVLQRCRIEYAAENYDEVLSRTDQLLQQLDLEKTSDLNLALNCYAFQIGSLLELERVQDAMAAAMKMEGNWDLLMGKLPSQYSKREKVTGELIRAMLSARFKFELNRDYAADLEQVRKSLESFDRPPHELAQWRVDVAELCYDAGHYDLALEQAEIALAAVPTLPRMNLVAAKSMAKLGRKDKALGYLRTFLQVMHKADEGLPRLTEARELYATLTSS